MRSVLFSITAVLMLAGAAQAQEGSYTGSGEGELSVEIKHIENDVFAVDFQTMVPMENDMPGCGGGISGEMIMDENGGNFFAENEFYDADAPDSPVSGERYCEIGISFDENGIMTVEERDGCMAYHGASCGFSGELIHADAAG